MSLSDRMDLVRLVVRQLTSLSESDLEELRCELLLRDSADRIAEALGYCEDLDPFGDDCEPDASVGAS